MTTITLQQHDPSLSAPGRVAAGSKGPRPNAVLATARAPGQRYRHMTCANCDFCATFMRSGSAGARVTPMSLEASLICTPDLTGQARLTSVMRVSRGTSCVMYHTSEVARHSRMCQNSSSLVILCTASKPAVCIGSRTCDNKTNGQGPSEKQVGLKAQLWLAETRTVSM